MSKNELNESQSLSLRNLRLPSLLFPPELIRLRKGSIYIYIYIYIYIERERMLNKIIPSFLLYHTQGAADSILRLLQIGFASGNSR